MDLDLDAVARVRELFREAGYTVDGVRALLGPVAAAALARHETVPALRATRGGGPLDALLRLFWLQVPVPATAVPRDDLLALGLAERSGDELSALLHVEPVERVAAPSALETAFGARSHDPAGYVVSDLSARP